MLEPDGPREKSPTDQPAAPGTAPSAEPILNASTAQAEPTPPPTQAPIELPPNDWPALRYWLAGPQPIAPPPPPWSRTYELPSARQVVSSGLQLALASTRPIRGASIYIGLLSLGAFGPTVILLLVGIGRLLTDPATADAMANDPFLVFFDQPELLGSFWLVYLLFALGLLLLIAIGIDAQAIAIALLAGTASGEPLRLWEAITRARQVFWRLLAAGFLVGVVSAVVSLLVTFPFLRPYDTNEGISFIGQMIGILAVTPFAFAGTGIVLGDVSPLETLKRSVTLFRASKRIALVVTLFTLVTAAIQTYAIGAGLDVAVRVAEALHLGLDQGVVPSLVLGVLILAFIVAYGSLAFTIAAIVAAPQVTGFLGLTFYTGGIDRARTPGETRPRGFRWVTIPMGATIAGIAIAGTLGLPSMVGLSPKPPSAILSVLRTAAQDLPEPVEVFGQPIKVDDPAGDLAGSGSGDADIVRAEQAYLPDVPDWLLDTVFACGEATVACTAGADGAAIFRDGALLVALRLAAPLELNDLRRVSVLIAAPNSLSAPQGSDDPFADASHAYVTRPGVHSLALLRYDGAGFHDFRSEARSTWSGTDVLTLIPFEELGGSPYGWDAVMLVDAEPDVIATRDTVRRSAADELIVWDDQAWIYFVNMTDTGSPPPFAP